MLDLHDVPDPARTRPDQGRRRGHRRRGHAVPRVQATGANQVWSWDISRLCGPRARDWFYLYVLIDIYSRKIVGWTIDVVESDKVAKHLIATACRREGIDRDALTLHSDRGAQMTSTTIAELLEGLDVTRSLPAPGLQRQPVLRSALQDREVPADYPARFDSIDEARTWMRRFAHWYNHDHYHSGIGYLHPAEGPRRPRRRRHRRPPNRARRRLPGQPSPLPVPATHRRRATHRSVDQQADHPDKTLKKPATTP